MPFPENDGRPPVHSLRKILNAIFYVVRRGCSWRLLPPRFPTLEGRLPLIPLLALGWYLGEDAPKTSQAAFSGESRIRTASQPTPSPAGTSGCCALRTTCGCACAGRPGPERSRFLPAAILGDQLLVLATPCVCSPASTSSPMCW
ncbi:MAG: transposase [Rubrobacteraceae bacterium]|nr:transposase [Rubrobacteraceae bacterium]